MGCGLPTATPQLAPTQSFSSKNDKNGVAQRTATTITVWPAYLDRSIGVGALSPTARILLSRRPLGNAPRALLVRATASARANRGRCVMLLGSDE